MAKPTAKSTVSQMKDYIRANRLNKAPILLGMKRADLIAGLRNQRNPFERSLTDPHRRPLRHPLGHPLIRRVTNS